MTFHEAALAARAALANAGLRAETAALDADLLARHAAGWDLATWLLRRSEAADEGFIHRFEALVARRSKREPVAYIRGTQEFWGRDFAVTPNVLIPRPETEFLVEEALAFLQDHGPATVADIGTGSGCIAVTLALEAPSATVWATDISRSALVIARQNAARHDVLHRMHFSEGRYLAAVPTPLDLIVCNPPYVAERDAPALAPEVRDHEPASALFGGNDGWRDIRMVFRVAAEALRPGGRLIVEVGYGQADRVADELGRIEDLRLDRIRDDLQGIPRVAIVVR